MNFFSCPICGGGSFVLWKESDTGDWFAICPTCDFGTMIKDLEK